MERVWSGGVVVVVGVVSCIRGEFATSLSVGNLGHSGNCGTVFGDGRLRGDLGDVHSLSRQLIHFLLQKCQETVSSSHSPPP